MRPFLLALMLVAAGCGTAAKVKRLEDREQDHYYALKVWMTDDDRKAFLKLKTPEERDQWLKDKGLWDRFYKYDDEKRSAIVEGDVQVGWKQDMVFMAWGEPASRSRLPGRPAERSELFIYRFEVDKKGNTLIWRPESNETYKASELYRLELIVDDQVVTEITKKDGWDQ